MHDRAIAWFTLGTIAGVVGTLALAGLGALVWVFLNLRSLGELHGLGKRLRRDIARLSARLAELRGHTIPKVPKLDDFRKKTG